MKTKKIGITKITLTQFNKSLRPPVKVQNAILRMDERFENIQFAIQGSGKLSKRDAWLYVKDFADLKEIVYLFNNGKYVEASDKMIDLDTTVREEISNVVVEWFNRVNDQALNVV